MISCAEAVATMWEYLEREVQPAEADDIAAHIAFCRRCCGEAEFVEELKTFLASRPPEDIPSEVQLRLLTTVEELGAGP